MTKRTAAVVLALALGAAPAFAEDTSVTITRNDCKMLREVLRQYANANMRVAGVTVDTELLNPELAEKYLKANEVNDANALKAVTLLSDACDE